MTRPSASQIDALFIPRSSGKAISAFPKWNYNPRCVGQNASIISRVNKQNALSRMHSPSGEILNTRLGLQTYETITKCATFRATRYPEHIKRNISGPLHNGEISQDQCFWGVNTSRVFIHNEPHSQTRILLSSLKIHSSRTKGNFPSTPTAVLSPLLVSLGGAFVSRSSSEKKNKQTVTRARNVINAIAKRNSCFLRDWLFVRVQCVRKS